MAAVVEGSLSYEGSGKGKESMGEPKDAVIFVGISLVLGIACRHILKGTRVPYTVALLIAGIAMGSLEYGTHHGLGKVGNGIRIWANINPDLLLFVFLPALLFESSFAMEVHQIKRCFMQMLLLAGPGVVISTFFLGTALKLTFPYGWDYKVSLLLGGLLSATDPVAVVALLKELGASKKLSTIIEGESLMNDGTAIVVYQLFYKMVLGKSFNFGEIIQFLSRVSLGAVALGLAFGIASILWLGFIFNDAVIEIALTLAISYITFYTAQGGADVSGVLAVMTLGMFFAAVAKTAFKGDSQQSLHHFWEMVAYIANTLIFILSGVVIAEGVLNGDNHFERHGSSWGYLVLLYVYVQLSRVVVVGLLYPFLRHSGYGFDWKESVILVWSGLRGAVALALSLSVKQASGVNQPLLTSELGTLFVFFTGGIVFLTLIINGSTTQFLLHLLAMDKLSAAKIRILNYTKYEMLKKSLEAYSDLVDDEELGAADWPTVQRYITCLSNLEADEHPHVVTESEDHLKRMSLSDMRVRLLNGVQAAYWAMLDEGRISQATAMILMSSVDEAMDVVSTETLSDWKGLKSNVHFPGYYRFLQMSRLPQRLVTYFTVERLESACSLCAAFLRAHRIARRQLHDFIGDSEIASMVINESSEEGEDARKFLEDVRINLPQVLRVVKTRQVTYSILKHLSEYVQNLEKVGLLEEKEMVNLDDAVQSDFKRLLRNPPLVKMPKVSDLIRAHPLLGALPVAVLEPLGSSTKELIKVRGTTLYKEGSKPNGIWLISMGVVKWESGSLRNNHSLHPTFSHGNTLGLYEVLVGKPYLCDMITDSVVHCFFFDSDKILALVKSDPAIEGFLWQESSLSISKILLPQIFEKMTMHELRALVAERSSMNEYIRGETIEIRSNVIGLLLQGFVRNEDVQQEFITSPAALFPSHSNLSIVSSRSTGFKNASFCHSASSYHVETRARVIFFDLGAAEMDSQRRTVSRISQSNEPVRASSSNHEGLMSWPENFFTARNSFVNETTQTSLSARAMELSIYGSMMNDMRGQFGSFRRSSQGRKNHSLSYPRVPTGTAANVRPLVSVQSEGNSMNTRLGTREPFRVAPTPPLPRRRRQRNVEGDDSSDDSGGEVIVRIDSPSTLSFSNLS
ncbi:sodium/hydrogen exchanger 8 isoform X1 [Dendrobium catenatum]|uniref:sodium/hydrogen exchanger 8 isoform X1 n=2 Tax=Dendrobium catenatum TaxID=906689 RepID=UPI0009F31B25|nr:sodium/hydrogen exchanger 8 isoform X1 [Dendrobium catenatum]